MARPPVPIKTDSGRPVHLIDEETDRMLGRIVIRHFIAFFVLLMLMTFVMAWANIEGSPLFPYHRFLDFLSILVVMTPFFVGTNRFFAARLKCGRKFVENKQWKEAVASLEAFNHLGQRFLDPSGEAHYLLSVSLAKEGKLTQADKVRDYVLQSHPNSPWAQKFRAAEQAKPRLAKSPAKRADSPAGAQSEENRPRAAKPKRRRL